MSKRIEENFRKRFVDRITCNYIPKRMDVEEERFFNKRLSEAFIALMANVLKRQPTKEEILGIVPITIKNKSKVEND